MKASKKALELFATMYEERTIRDRLMDAMDLCKDEEERAEILEIMTKHNRKSNAACAKLHDMGYFACRDEDNDYVPTMWRCRQVVAYWDERDGIIEL